MTWKLALFIVLAAGGLTLAAAKDRSSSSATAKPEAAVQSDTTTDSMRVEGEKRFQANCGRCHQFPHKFPPRMILTIERHMRVRALVTDDDMRLIVKYLTQ